LRILVSWLRDFVDVPAAPPELARTLSMCGFEVAAIEPAPPGVPRPDPAAGDLGQADAVIDFEITANRPDCLSVVGMAREAATAFDRPLHNLPSEPSPDAGRALIRAGTAAEVPGLKVTVEDPDLCPRYAAAVAEVRVGPSPPWLASRLQAAGVRPINNVVDVTNYVLLETGHPMHAFDLERLGGGELRIRRARAGERLQTLDGEQRTLDAEMLVIADAARPQAVGGVMGGASSEVSSPTRLIALESAYFKPASVRRTSKQLGLKTEASTRFERGADIDAPVAALERAGDLLAGIGAGRIRGALIDCYPDPREAATVSLGRERIARLLGQRVDDGEVERILHGLSFRATARPDGWEVAVPSWRVDVSREVDLIEEVARHHGYDRLPATFPALTTVPAPPDPRILRGRLLRRVLAAAGFTEAITYAFIETGAAAPFAGDAEVVPIAHPLSEKFAVLRPSLLPGLVEALAHNRRRASRDVRLFEIGACFSRGGGERRGLGLAWTGAASLEHWSGTSRAVDFFDMKGIVERLCGALRVAARFEPERASHLVPGRTAVVRSGETSLGVFGLLAPALAQARDVPAGDDVYVAELDLETVARVASHDEIQSEPPPRFPSVVRDLSIIVAETLPAELLRAAIRAAAPAMLVGLTEFDRYRGKGIPEGRVSLSFHLTFRSPDRTLTDAEVQQAMDAIVAVLAREHGAIQR
jgi:phenylalanyl-tRNA synthetase beta chain